MGFSGELNSVRTIMDQFMTPTDFAGVRRLGHTAGNSHSVSAKSGAQGSSYERKYISENSSGNVIFANGGETLYWMKQDKNR